MLSSTLHVQAALKLAPILPQKSQEMQVVHDLQLYRKQARCVSYFFHAKETKETVSHTVRAWKTRENVELDGPEGLWKECG